MTYLLNIIPTYELCIDSVRLILQRGVKLGMANPLLSIRADPLVLNIYY